MFTGIVIDLGKIKRIEDRKYHIVANKKLVNKLVPGTSIAVNGVCLTAKAVFKQNTFMVEVMPETLKKTMLANLREKELVNLELPMTIESFFSGHIVQGHVDTVAEIAKIQQAGNSKILVFELPVKFSKYIVNKGSIAVNGVSLTVIEVARDGFSVGIIPYTWENTTFRQSKVGDKVNIEVDIIAKYVEKLINKK